MKKLIAVILAVAAIVGVRIALTWRTSRVVVLESLTEQPTIPWIKPDPNAFSQAEPNQVVFDMTYRGLSGVKDPLFLQSFWGIGTYELETDPAFIKALKDKGIGPLHLVYNARFRGAQWSAVELRGKRPVAFYLDLDANGKVTANERLTPTPTEQKDVVDFVTPDFCMTTEEGSRVPFRVLLRTQRYGRSELNCMWSSACVLEGESTLEGQPAKLILSPYGPSGAYERYGQYGQSMVGLAVGPEQGQVERASLSSLIRHQGQFYQLRVQSNTSRQAVRVLLARDVSPRGKLVVGVACENDPDARLPWARITGGEGSIHLNLRQDEEELPVGKYRLERGQIAWSSGETSWRCDFQKGPEFDVAAAQETRVRLGQPKLMVRVVPEDKRYEENTQSQSVYVQGARIYITRQVQGMTGEEYGRFSKKGVENWYQDVKPQIRITDPDGKEVIAKPMEYG